MMPATQRVLIWQVIPHLALGGATRVALWLAEHLDPERFAVQLVAGVRQAEEGSLEEQVRARGIPLLLLPDLHRDLHPLADCRALGALRELIARYRPALVHAHGSKALLLTGLATRGAGVPAVHTAHGWPFHPGQNPLSRWTQVQALRYAMRDAAAIVAVSQATRQQGLAAGLGRPEQYHVIPPGAELDRFTVAPEVRPAIRQALGLPPEAVVVGSVMRLSPQKAPFDLIAAAALVCRQWPQVHFVIVGGGPLQGAVQAAIQAAGLSDRVHLTGPRTDIPELMSAFDMFALSSRWEGLPIVYAEAGAAGLPVVGTAVDGAAELIAHEVTGLLTPPGDPAQLAACLSALIADPERRQIMGQAACRQVRELGLDVATVVRQHETLYETVLAR
jgi:glycosyltransferase involved in cell wall biosynthesis